MYEGDQLRYGWISGGKASVPVPMAASEVMKVASGRFININTSGFGEILDDQDSAECFGSAEGPEETTNATAGGTVYNTILDLTAIFKMPVDTGTYAITMLGDTCDVGLTSDVQGVFLTASSNEQFIIVGGDVANNNWALVMINSASANRGQTNVA